MNTSKTIISLLLALSILLSLAALTGCNYGGPHLIPTAPYITPNPTTENGNPTTEQATLTPETTDNFTNTDQPATQTPTPDPSATFTPSDTATPSPTNTPTTPDNTDQVVSTPTPTDTPPTTPIETEDPVIEIPLSKNESDYYFSTDGMFKMSKDHNVIVFVLDRLDYDYITSILKTNSNFFNRLDGFTSYTNATSEFARTLPGGSHILTGYETDVYLQTKKNYLDNAWASNNILNVIKNQGYDVDIFANMNEMFGTPSKYARTVSNMSWDVENMESTKYTVDDVAFSKGIKSMSLTQKGNAFKYYHLNGSHQPYNLNSDGTESSESTNALKQTMGCFSILFQYFNKMKELGIYQSSEIFILADHGSAISDYKPLTKATAIGMFHKPSGVANKAFTTSTAPVSHKNISPAVFKAVGVKNYLDYGTPLYDIAPNANITRYFYKSVMTTEKYDEEYVCKYAITGNALDFNNWKLIETFDVKYHFY